MLCFFDTKIKARRFGLSTKPIAIRSDYRSEHCDRVCTHVDIYFFHLSAVRMIVFGKRSVHTRFCS